MIIQLSENEMKEFEVFLRMIQNEKRISGYCER